MATAAPKTPEAQAAKATKKRYVVISPLRHDGERYAEGDEIELSQAVAEQLLGHTVKEASKAAKADA